jgi:hypothetical protein
MRTNFILQDNFNHSRISGHRTLRSAVLAKLRHAASLSRRSPGSYVWYAITDAYGVPHNSELILETEMEIQNRR